MKKRYAVLLAILAGLIAVVISGCGSTEIDLSKYIDVTYSGLDGKGEASLQFDREKLQEEIDYTLLSDNQKYDFDKNMAISTLSSSVSATLDKCDGLSNGDKIVVSISVSEEEEKKCNVKFVGTEDKEFIVEGLKEIVELDAFDSKWFDTSDGVVLNYSGTSPNLTLEISNNITDDVLSKIQYSASKQYNIKKGESITITAELPYGFEDEGYVLKEESKTVVCDNVAEYIQSIDDIDDETWDKIKAQCDDLFTANFSDISKNYRTLYTSDGSVTLSSAEKVENFKYDSIYFLSQKEGIEHSHFSSSFNHNGMYLMFSFDLKGSKKFLSNDKKDYNNCYGAFLVKDLIKNPDGKIEFSINQIDVCYYFYTDKDSFKVENINKDLDDFTLTESESKFK